jgi:alkyldihydroxyacetonephosphate synthase
MAVIDPGLLDELRALLPPDGVRTGAGELGLHAHDFWPRLILRKRAGEALAKPAAVVAPTSTGEVAAVLAWATARGVAVVPFGAGTGVCGGAAPVAGAITLDLKRLDAVLDLDEVSGTVTVQPGIIAQALEDHLAHRGWTLGHFPSSIHCSTIGGFLAVRSAGQASSSYGKLEDAVVGLEAVLADGTVYRSRPVPSAAVGPDLNRLFVGGEGVTGVITEATLRIWPAPSTVLDRGLLFADVPAALDGIRAIMQAGVRPTIFRLYDEADTAMVFSGRGQDAPQGCLAIVGAEGPERVARFVHDFCVDTLLAAGGQDLGPEPGAHWRANRHTMSYRFAEFMKPGGAFGDAVMLDTMEVAAVWARLPGLYEAVRGALGEHSDIVLAHFSHVYPEGSSIYFTFGAAAEGDEDEALRRYDAAWDAGQRAATAAGGTISHHHGVGLARVPWLATELGAGGMEVLRRVKDALDPSGLLNPGTLGVGRRVDRG